MTIYVDDITDYGPKGLWCHMWADTEFELHEFAAKIGLKRSWCHVSVGMIGRWPHYDLRPSKRELALHRGAEYIPLTEWLRQQPPFIRSGQS